MLGPILFAVAGWFASPWPWGVVAALLVYGLYVYSRLDQFMLWWGRGQKWFWELVATTAIINVGLNVGLMALMHWLHPGV